MPHSTPKLLEKRLKLGVGVSTLVAVQACEEACLSVGLAVVSRGESSFVFLPRPSRSLLNCLVPGSEPAISADPKAGRGVTAEIVPSRAGDGRLAVLISADQKGKGKDFVSALRTRLRECAFRANRTAQIEARQRTREVCDVYQSMTAARHGSSAAYMEVSSLLRKKEDESSAGAFVAKFIEEFNCKYACPQVRSETQALDNAAAITTSLFPLAELKNAVTHVCERIREFGSAEQRPHFEQAVWKYFFARVGCAVWQHYRRTSNEADLQYRARKDELASLDDQELMRLLNVDPTLRAAEGEEVLTTERNAVHTHPASPIADDDGHENIQDNDEEHEEDTAAAEVREAPRAGILNSSYGRVLTALSRVEGILSGDVGCAPWEAVDAVAFAHSEMRASALDRSESRTADVTPLFIALVVRSSIEHPFACAQLMQDTLRLDAKPCDVLALVSLLDSCVKFVTYSLDVSTVSGDSGNTD